MAPLPVGKTCGDCQFFRQCVRLCAALATDEECAYSPCIFSPLPPAPRSAAAVIIAQTKAPKRAGARTIKQRQIQQPRSLEFPCPTCKGPTIKFGHNGKGRQRRRCPECCKSFGVINNSDLMYPLAGRVEQVNLFPQEIQP